MRRRSELGSDVNITPWKLLLPEHELRAASEWLQRRESPVLYTLRATAVDGDVPKLLEERLMSRAEAAVQLGPAVQQGLDKLL